MTNFIDLIYCSGFGGKEVLAYAPMIAYIKKGDIVRIDGMKDFYMVLCNVTVSKDSDNYKFITGVLGEPKKVIDKYSHNEIGGTENE